MFLISLIYGMFYIGALAIVPFVFIYFVFFKRNIPEEVKQEEEKGLELPKMFTVAIFLIILAINLFVYNLGDVGIGLSLFNLVTLLSLLLLIPKRKHNVFLYTLMVASAIAGFGLAFRASGSIQGLDVFVMKFVFIVSILTLLLDQINWKGLWLIRALWLLVIRFIRNVPVVLKSSRDYKKSVGLGLIRAFVITFFLVVAFAAILSSADPVFSKMISDLMPQIIGRSFVSLLVAILLFFVFSSKLKVYLDKEANVNFVAFYDLFIPILSVVLLFGLFLFVQAKYLFGSHNYVQEFGLTYSEYVRKGFIELLLTTFLGGLLAYFTAIKNRVFENRGHEIYIKIINSVLLIELFLMLASAFMRDKIYVDTYGYTRVRVIGGFFLLWLFVSLFFLLVLNVYKKVSEKWLFASITYLGLLLILVLNFVNVDEFIIKSNIPHTEYSSRDYFYTNILSEDAVSGWKDSIGFANDTFDSLYQKPVPSDNERKLLADIKLSMIALKEKRDNLAVKFGTIEDLQSLANAGNESRYDLFNDTKRAILSENIKNLRNSQSFNFSKYNAYKEIQGNKKLFYVTTECLIKEIGNYQLQYKVDLYMEENSRLYDFKYPFVALNLRYSPSSTNGTLREMYYKNYGYYPSRDRDLSKLILPAAKSCK